MSRDHEIDYKKLCTHIKDDECKKQKISVIDKFMAEEDAERKANEHLLTESQHEQIARRDFIKNLSPEEKKKRARAIMDGALKNTTQKVEENDATTSDKTDTNEL
ncbi:MAG: hypothetical protein AB7S44_02990 [Spirochaetales bacterium]